MYIESRQNERIKDAIKLKDKTIRSKTGLFFFEGAALLEEFLRNGHVPQTVFVTRKALGRYTGITNKIPRDALIVVSDDVFTKLTTEKAPQGIFTVSRFLDKNIQNLDDPSDCEKIPKNKGVVLLHSLQDTGNVGTIIRTAAAFNSAYCVLSRDCADIYNHKTIRATMGALFSGLVYIAGDFEGCVKHLRTQGRRVFSAALREPSVSLKEHSVLSADCYIIGSEGSGLSDEIISLCDGVIKIPISEKAESLNASVAATVILWELSKTEGKNDR